MIRATNMLANNQLNPNVALHSKTQRQEKKDGYSTMMSCNAILNSLKIHCQAHQHEIKSANTIKSFLRKVIAAQSYHAMFSEGSDFKKLGLDLPKLTTPKASLYSLKHLDDVSTHYLKEIREKTPNLTLEEKKLLIKVMNTPWHFRHQSNAKLVTNGTLNIHSQRKLRSEGVIKENNTCVKDIEDVSNHDFVFFGVEFSSDESLLPLNTKHMSTTYGINAYITTEQFPFGFLTLTDHARKMVPWTEIQEHSDFIEQFLQFKNEVGRLIHGNKGQMDFPIFNTRDMKKALGLHLIDFIRRSADAEFKKFALNENLDGYYLDRILNSVFQPEFHVPRVVSTTHFTAVSLKDISLEEAVKTVNMERISKKLKNKNAVHKAMSLAIEYGKPDIVNYILLNCHFTTEDVQAMEENNIINVAELITSYLANEHILKLFLDRGVLDVNKPLSWESTDTMLDNAIEFNNEGIITLLRSYGALRGKDLQPLQTQSLQ